LWWIRPVEADLIYPTIPLWSGNRGTADGKNVFKGINQPLRVLRPAIFPDDMWLVYLFVAAEAVGALYGFVAHVPVALFLSLVVMGLFPGMPLAFHSIAHFTVRIEVFEDRFAVVSVWPLGSLLRIGREQQLGFKDISYAYYLEREIDFLKRFVESAEHERETTGFDDLILAGVRGEIRVPDAARDDSNIPEVFLRTKLDFSKYLWVESRPRGRIGTARVRSCLVLSNRDGSQKVYMMNFYDLSSSDSRYFFRTLMDNNPSIRFLMDTGKVRRLFKLS
jgi:hypothetical protein